MSELHGNRNFQENRSFTSYQIRILVVGLNSNAYSRVDSYRYILRSGEEMLVCCPNSQTIESDIFLNMPHILSSPRLILMQIHAYRVLN
jgi:hypothetical protein